MKRKPSGRVSSSEQTIRDLKEVVAEQTLEPWLLKKSMLGDGANSNEISGLRET